jgi:16S rRNA C967 or C1407 C5-methylase (RsmB/RsmF family)
MIKALKEHPPYYLIRTNTLETDTQTLYESLKKKDIPIEKHPVLEDVFQIKVKGPNELTVLPKKVIAYKNAAEAILQGANLGSQGTHKRQINLTTSKKREEDWEEKEEKREEKEEKREEKEEEIESISIGDQVSIIDKFGSIVANGIAMMDSKDLGKNKGVAVKVTEAKYEIPNLSNLKEYLRGQFISQDLISLLIGEQVTLKKGDYLMDMAANDGEIVSHIWQKNHQIKGTRIFALEKSNSKTQAIKENLERLRIRPTAILKDFAKNNRWKIEIMKMPVGRLRNKFSKDETFNWIILNAPNSNTGLRPKIHDTTYEKRILRLINLQRTMMTEAARLIKPGGIIFYGTNSLDPGENELIIKYAIEELGLSVIKQKHFLGDEALPYFEGANLVQRFYPHKRDTHGGFLAKLTK